MDTILVLTIATVAIVLFFALTNGFHDASNIIATAVATRAMTPIQAVILAGTFHFIGPMLGGTAVANTLGKFVDLGGIEAVTAMTIVLCGLTGAIGWNLLTWWFGIPSSSSHALVGGLVGTVMIAAGTSYVLWGWVALTNGHLVGVMKVLLALIVAPIIGFWAGFWIHRCAAFLLRGARPIANKYPAHVSVVDLR